MLLLHISDIHFRLPDCRDPHTDPERPYRTRLLNDARVRAEQLNGVGAILVTGDIAFKGHPDEFSAAKIWLHELAAACGCPLERIFVVPGNHDVDRSVVREKISIRNAHAAIERTDLSRRERELRNQLQDADAGRNLFAPHAAYNEFAKFFGCQIYAPDRIFWRQDLPLDSGVILRIHGLTSTLLSGINGEDDQKGRLYLSPLQTVLDPTEGIVHLAMAHHPPDWCSDHDDVDDALNERASLHLFGHKHRQRILQTARYVRYSAGAVNPDRNDLNWQPGYNLINLGVAGSGTERKLIIETHVLEFQSNPERFRPRQHENGLEVFRDSIPLPCRNSPASIDNPNPRVEVCAEAIEGQETEVSVSDETTRNLLNRFWDLTSSQRREITLRLGLIDKEELTIPEPERYSRALIRAGERNLVESLAQEVSKLER